MEAVVVKQEEGSAAGVAGFGGVSEGRGGGEPSLSSLPLFGESAKPIGDGLSLGSDLSKRREGLEALQEIFARRCKDVLALYQVYQKKWKDDQKDRRSRAHRANLRAKALARESERDKKRSRADQDAAPSTKRKAKRRDSNANANGSLAEAALAENRDLTDREWKKYEQDKGRKLLLIYGLDDWEKIRSQLLEGHKAFCHGVKDIRNFSYTFLLALRNELQKQQQQKQQQEGSAKEGVPSTGTATSAMSVSAKEDAFVKKKLEDMATKGATDVHHLLKEWTKIDKLHVSWVKKLRLLDGLHEAVRLYKDEKTRSQVDQAMTILSEGVLPVEWWTTEADLGLLFGVCKHGYGAYDKIRADPEFEKAFSSRGPIQKQKQSNTNAYRGHPEGCKCVSCYHRRKKEEKAQEEEELRKARKAEIANKAPEEEKDEKKNKEKDGLVGADAADAMDGDDDGGGDWPAVEALTKRLKRIVECMSKVQRKVAKSAVQERKEIEKAREWSKKEKSKLANTVMRWGTPLGEDGEPDWAQLRDLSGLSKKEDASLQTCYYSLVEEANTLRELHAKKLEERRKVSSKEAIAKDQGVEDKKSEAPADDAASDTSGDTIVEEVAHASSLADTSTTQAAGTELVGDVPAETKQVQKVDKEVQQDRKEQVAAKTTLTPITAVRLMERIELMSLLRKMMEDDDWDWNVRHMRELPQWWEPHHDKILIKGILKHGAAQWPFIAQDKELGFPLEREEEKESTNSDTKLDPFPEQKSCVKRCKQIQGAYQRYCNRLQNPPLQKSTKEKRPAVPRKVNKKPKKEEIKVEEKVVAEESISAANDLLQIKIKVSELDHDQLRRSGDGLEEGRSTAKSPKVEVEKEQEKKTVQVRRSKRKR